MNTFKKVFWFSLAVLFLIETWLWNHMAALIKRIVAAIPLDATKAWIVAKVEPLSPWPTLLVFLIPVIILEPFKIIGLWLFAKGHIIAGGAVFLAAKIVGLGVIAFLFETCKPKLMQFRLIAWSYNKCIQAKNWAKREIAPTLARIRILTNNLHERVNSLKNSLAKYLPTNKGMFEKIIRRIKALRRKLS
jgi:hypothetical protein